MIAIAAFMLIVVILFVRKKKAVKVVRKGNQ